MLAILIPMFRIFFFFNDTATTEIYTLSLHDALPILSGGGRRSTYCCEGWGGWMSFQGMTSVHGRSEEHTSELQSQSNLVCRLLLEKKKNLLKKLYSIYDTTYCLDVFILLYIERHATD